MEVLSGVIIPKETTSETLATAIGRIVEAKKISFHDDEYPAEGTGHNKALHIVVKCCDKIVSSLKRWWFGMQYLSFHHSKIFRC